MVGFFSSLFGKKQPTNLEVVPDRIWMTTDAKYAGLAAEAEDRSMSEPLAILLVAHFPDVLARLEKVANRRTWRVPLKAVSASKLNTGLAAGLNASEADTIDVIVAERHPLPSVDDRLEAFADELPCRCRFAHHLSLDDAVMETFGGEWVRDILRGLGMSDDQAIESQMVARRIRQAQLKIEGEAYGSSAAGSAAEWLANNCPSLIRK